MDTSARHQHLGGRHPCVAGADDLLDRFDGLGAVGKGGHGLGAAHGPHLIDRRAAQAVPASPGRPCHRPAPGVATAIEATPATWAGTTVMISVEGSGARPPGHVAADPSQRRPAALHHHSRHRFDGCAVRELRRRGPCACWRRPTRWQSGVRWRGRCPGCCRLSGTRTRSPAPPPSGRPRSASCGVAARIGHRSDDPGRAPAHVIAEGPAERRSRGVAVVGEMRCQFDAPHQADHLLHRQHQDSGGPGLFEAGQDMPTGRRRRPPSATPHRRCGPAG